mgnify:CR=1 FL=1
MGKWENGENGENGKMGKWSGMGNKRATRSLTPYWRAHACLGGQAGLGRVLRRKVIKYFAAQTRVYCVAGMTLDTSVVI